MESITLYQRFEADILSGKKTITIRDTAEKHYFPGSLVQALTFEDQKKFGKLKILSVESIQFKQLNKSHAQQENMSLDELKKVIQKIYPNTKQLFIISFILFKF